MENRLLTFEKYEFKLVIFSSIFLFVMKFFFTDNYGAIFVNSLLDFFILLAIYGIFHYLAAYFKKSKITRITAVILFYVFFTINFMGFMINSIFLDDSLLFKFTFSFLFANDLGMLSFFVTEIIPLQQMALLLLLIAFVFWIPKGKIKRLKNTEPHIKKTLLILAVVCAGLIMFNFNLVGNVYANTVYEQLNYNTLYTLSINETSIARADIPPSFDKQFSNYSQIFPGNQRVLLFVMEGVSYNAFLADLANIPSDKNFFEKVKQNTHFFTNYYTNNQDSRTAVWTMLNSRFIPFEAYINDWNDKFGGVLGSNNLVDYFNSQGYSTQVVASVLEPSILLKSHNWSKNNFLTTFDENNPDYACLHVYEFEKGCEDTILLDDVKRVIKENKELFLMQEFIFGHGTAYELKIQKTPTRYYNDYLLELYSFLENEDLLDNTTIIIVSDHGEKIGYKQLYHYQVPFMIINNNLDSKEISDLYSHLELKEILLHYLAGEELTPPENVYIIGQTQSSEIGYVEADGKHVLGKLRPASFEAKRSQINKSIVEDKLSILLKYQRQIYEESNIGKTWCASCWKP